MATPATSGLSVQNRSMLKAWSKAGDILARELLSLVSDESSLGRTQLNSLGHPAAKSVTSVHAAIRGDTAITNVTTGLTNPDVPRNVRVAFGASWDGGDAVVVGTDQFDAAVTDTLTSAAGTTVVGTKIFKTVTSIHHTVLGTDAGGTNTYSVGTGDKLGIVPKPITSSPVLLTVDGVGEASTFDATTNAITPTTAPDGTKVFVLQFNQ